jgi:hypothetical protein
MRDLRVLAVHAPRRHHQSGWLSLIIVMGAQSWPEAIAPTAAAGICAGK